MLANEVDKTEGWYELLNEGGATGHTKQLEDGDTALRVSCELDIKPEYAIHMFTAGNEEMPTWYTDLKKVEVLEEFGPGDKLTRWSLNLSWALTYVMGIPEQLDIRLVVRENWPEDGNFSYCTVPYDPEKKIPVESYGRLAFVCWPVKHLDEVLQLR